jgi:ATP-binding cassette subfamily F protein uup
VAVLSARDLVKAYGPQTLFDRVALTISEGEHVGLLGQNGMGKSTLLRVLAGIEPADEGVIERKRGATILYLPQEPKLPATATPRQIVEEGLAEWHKACARHAEVTAAVERGATHDALLVEQAQLAEDIERLGGWAAGHRASDMLHRLGVLEVDREVGSMSGGEQRRVALAKILVAQPDLAILDEPTNHLDVETIEYLEEYLAERFSGAVLLVTHDRYVLDAISDRILELEHGVLTEYSGNYSDYLEQKETLLAHAERSEQNRLNRLRRERAWLLRGAKARTTKQKARIKRAHELMAVEPPKTNARTELTGLEAGASQSGKTILELIDVRMEIANRTLIAGLTLYMVQGDRIGIVGPNGAGKTTLLKLVAGEIEPTRGRVVRGARTKIAYFDQARAGLRDDWSVFDNVAERQGAERDGGGQVQIGDLTLELRSYLERFLFDGGKQRQKVAALSGGERARVALAKALRGGANLLLLDEPTNDLDLATLSELEDLLESWPGCSIVVSHDRAFLNRVVTSVLAFERDSSVVRYTGNYDDYRLLRAAAQPREAPETGPARATVTNASGMQATTNVAASPKPLTYAERLELAGIVDAIAAAEERLTGLSATLSDPATYAGDANARQRLQADYERARTEVARLTARWEALEARSAARK